VWAALDGNIDLSNGSLRCLHDDRHSTLLVLVKKGGSWMVEVLYTYSYVADMAGLGKKGIP
jgi:hypothetical protein